MDTTEQLLDRVGDYIDENPGSLYTDILLDQMKQGDYNGMWYTMSQIENDSLVIDRSV